MEEIFFRTLTCVKNVSLVVYLQPFVHGMMDSATAATLHHSATGLNPIMNAGLNFTDVQTGSSQHDIVS